MEENIPKPEKIGANPVFVVLYLLIFIGIFLLPGVLRGFNSEAYSWDSFKSLSVYLIPAFLFSLIGIMTVRSKKSLIYAICGAVVSLVIIVFTYQIWMDHLI